jgi:LDH2 family malate/lactate/ureidoglycolate dehydrogenase
METPTIARVDGDKGFGGSSRGTASRWGSRRLGLRVSSAVTLRRTNHVGPARGLRGDGRGPGLIGMLWVNAPTALNVAPQGSAARRLGTNPHAVAVPGPNATVAMSHDFATSVVAEGKLKVKVNARREGGRAPGIMRNGRGEPSTDPRRVLHPARLADHRREHKGYGPRSPSRSSAASCRAPEPRAPRRALGGAGVP